MAGATLDSEYARRVVSPLLPPFGCWIPIAAEGSRYDGSDRPRQGPSSDHERDRQPAPRALLGATRGRTIIHGDHVICFLEDIYTKAERTLIDAGRTHEVIQARNAFQDAMEAPFRKAVEDLTGRRVVGFLSQVGTDPDIGIEAFWLAPDGAKPQ